jgi:hypothetical protein
MKNFPQVALRSSLVMLAALLLPSCVIYDDYYGGAYDVGVGYSSGDYYIYGGTRYYYPPAYPAYTVWSPVNRYYYGGRYYSYAWWNDHRYRSYRHDHRGHHHASNHSRYSNVRHVDHSRNNRRDNWERRDQGRGRNDSIRHDRDRNRARAVAPSYSPSRYSPPVRVSQPPRQGSARRVEVRRSPERVDRGRVDRGREMRRSDRGQRSQNSFPHSGGSRERGKRR